LLQISRRFFVSFKHKHSSLPSLHHLDFLYTPFFKIYHYAVFAILPVNQERIKLTPFSFLFPRSSCHFSQYMFQGHRYLDFLCTCFQGLQILPSLHFSNVFSLLRSYRTYTSRIIDRRRRPDGWTDFWFWENGRRFGTPCRVVRSSAFVRFSTWRKKAHSLG
jgi:hypothetical protein